MPLFSICLQLTFLAETSLGKRSSFKVSSSQYALYLSLALEKGKDAKVGMQANHGTHGA